MKNAYMVAMYQRELEKKKRDYVIQHSRNDWRLKRLFQIEREYAPTIWRYCLNAHVTFFKVLVDQN